MMPSDTLDLIEQRQSPSDQLEDAGIVVGSPQWDELTIRRGSLIIKDSSVGLDDDEAAELRRLQRISADAIALAFPAPRLSPEDLAVVMKAINRG